MLHSVQIRKMILHNNLGEMLVCICAGFHLWGVGGKGGRGGKGGKGVEYPESYNIGRTYFLSPCNFNWCRRIGQLASLFSAHHLLGACYLDKICLDTR